MRRGCVNMNHIVFLCWEMISWKRRCSKFLQLHIGANVLGSTFELGIWPGFQVSLLFVSFGHTLVPEQSCPFCSYSLSLEHLTLGCEFVDAAVCCESVVSYGWEYFLQPSMDLGSWELRFFMSGRARLRSSLHYNKDAGCSKVFPPSNLFNFFYSLNVLEFNCPATPAYIGASGGECWGALICLCHSGHPPWVPLKQSLTKVLGTEPLRGEASAFRKELGCIFLNPCGFLNVESSKHTELWHGWWAL